MKNQKDNLRTKAKKLCRKKHPHLFDSMICVGVGSERGFGPPCDECLSQAIKRNENRKKKS